MNLPAKTSHHVVFPVEFDRGVLVVSPRGDAVAFRDVDVHQELETLMQSIDDGTTRHLIVDFGSANYYGSTIIGAVVGLARKVNEQSGQAVFCSLSTDMANVLRIMHLDQLWPIFDSLKAAKAFVRKVSG